MKIFIWLISIVAFLYLSLGVFLYIKQRSLLYFPQPYQQTLYPSMVLAQPDARIDVIQLTTHSAHPASANADTQHTKPAIIYFGGNAEAVINSAALFEPLKASYDIYLVNYRGYGESTGQITEANNYTDALTVYEVVATRIAKNNQPTSISLVGRSLGSGVASYVATKKPVAKLVLITPFDSILKVAQDKFPIYPLGLLLKDTYPSAQRAANIQAETLILAAQADQVAPATHAQALRQAFTTQPSYHEIAKANHNDIMTKQQAVSLFYDFFN